MKTIIWQAGLFLTATTVYLFNILPCGGIFYYSPDMFLLDLSKNYIYFMLSIVKSDGSACAITQGANAALQGDLVLPINILGKTFFRQIKVYLNGMLISDSGDKYAYRCFLETELNFRSEAKNALTSSTILARCWRWLIYARKAQWRTNEI